MLPTSVEVFPRFAWAVPRAYADSLAKCQFDEGSIFYNTAEAYQIWERALEVVRYAVQIKRVYGSTPIEDAQLQIERESVFKRNWGSRLQIELTEFNPEPKVTLLETTNGQVYLLLWHGDLGILKDEMNFTRPLSISAVQKHLEYLADKVKEFDGAAGFILPFDSVNLTSKEKRKRLDSYLLNLPHSVKEIDPKESGLPGSDRFAPTISFLCYVFSRECPINVIEKHLQGALSGGEKIGGSGKSNRFNLRKHGLFIPIAGI